MSDTTENLERCEFCGEIVKEATKFAARLICSDGLCDLWCPLEICRSDNDNGLIKRRLVFVAYTEYRIVVAVSLAFTFRIVRMFGKKVFT